MAETKETEAINIEKQLVKIMQELMYLQNRYSDDRKALIHIKGEEVCAEAQYKKFKIKFENTKNSFTDFDDKVYKKYRKYFNAELKLESTKKDLLSFKGQLEFLNRNIEETQEKIQFLEETKISLEKELEKIFKKED